MGQNDYPIDPNVNCKTIEKIRAELATVGYTRIYASPLIRCRQTADLIFPGAEITFDARLMEKDLGDWADCDKGFVRENYPQYFTEDGKLDISMTPPNGESFRALCSRLKAFINDMLYQHNGETIAVVTHGGVIAVLTRFLCCSAESKEVSLSTQSIEHLGYFEITVDAPL